MSNPPNIQQNVFNIRNLQQKDMLDRFQRQLFLQFNAHHLGTIQAFDAEKQTATVSINYKKTYFKFEGKTQVYEPYLVDYPLLADVPVIVLGGGTCHITFPIAVGDQCILLFNDRDIDNWYSGSTTSANQSSRLHAFADAFALIGPNNLNTLIENYDAVRTLITNGHVKIGVNPSNNKVTLQNDSFSLKAILQDLCTKLENLTEEIAKITVTCAAPGNPSSIPINALTIVAYKPEIEQISTNLGALLE